VSREYREREGPSAFKLSTGLDGFLDTQDKKVGSFSSPLHDSFDSSGSWKMLPTAINQLIQ